jgi:hypothetical protein
LNATRNRTTIELKLLLLQLIFYSVNIQRVVSYIRSTDIVSHIEQTKRRRQTEKGRERERENKDRQKKKSMRE